MAEELTQWSAVDLVAAYRACAVSPREVTEAVLARIERLEPELHALYAPDPEGALAAARASEGRWQGGDPLGPVDGVPLTLKENIATRGLPTPLGTAATDGTPATEDAPAAARVRESGGVLLAKTTMPDYGMLTSGLSSYHAASRNPWDTTRTPGGSSAGAAAAAAAGYGPLHVGTDIGGSIRLPAGWCGLVGFKPSFGRLPVVPPFPGRVVGPLTRTVADAALLTGLLARPDPRDHLSLPPADIPWHDLDDDRAIEGMGLRQLRVGLQLDAGIGLPVEPEVSDAVAEVARWFEAAGATVEPVRPYLTREMLDGLDRFWRTRFAVEAENLPPERKARILPYIREWIAGGAGLSGEDVYRGFAQLDAVSVAALRASEPYDLLVSPTCPTGPPAFDAPSPTGDPARPLEHIAFTVPSNMSGQPSLSINCGYTSEGLPIGVQLTGRRFDDLGVLRAGAIVERLRPPPRPWPTLVRVGGGRGRAGGR